MKKKICILILSALLGALCAALVTAQTQLPSSLQWDVQIGGTWTLIGGSNPDTAHFFPSEVTITQEVRTNGYAILVENGGKLTVSSTGKLVLDKKLNTSRTGQLTDEGLDVITLGAGTTCKVEPGGQVIAGSDLGPDPSATGTNAAQGITLTNDGTGQTIENFGLIDFGNGGRIDVKHTGATVKTPGLIVLKTDRTLQGDGVANATVNGFFYTRYERNGTAKDELDVWGGEEGKENEWTALLQAEFDSRGGKVIEVNEGAFLSVPLNVTLTLRNIDTDKEAEKVTLNVLGGSSSGGTLNVEGHVVNYGLVNVDAGDSEGGLVNLLDHSFTENYGIVRMQDGTGTPTIEAKGGAEVHNYGVIDLVEGEFKNSSRRIHSPGIILADLTSESGATIDGGEALASGFIKVSGATPDKYIDIYGKENVWTEWHNAFLNGGDYEVLGVKYEDETTTTELRVNKSGKLTIPDGVELKLTNGDAAISVQDSLVVEGTVNISKGSVFITKIDGKGNPVVWITETGKVNIDGGSVTAASDADAITNAGIITISDKGSFTNNCTDVTSTGIILVTGSGSITGDEDLYQGAIVVKKPTASTPQYSISIYKGVTWSDDLQSYLDDGANRIYLYTNNDTIYIPSGKQLVVPTGQSLELFGNTDNTPNPAAGYIIGYTTQSYTSKGLTTLTNFPLENLLRPDGKSTAIKTGFFQTDNKTITVFGTGNTWDSYLDNKFSILTNATLSIPGDDDGDTEPNDKNNELTFSALNIPSTHTVKNEGRLLSSNGSVVIGGTLQKGAESTTNIRDGGITFTNGGKILAEMREKWISPANDTVITHVSHYDSLYTVHNSEADADSALTVGSSFNVENPWGGNTQRRVLGLNTSSGHYGYYGYVDVDYTLVTGISINNKPANDTIYVAYNEDTTLTVTTTGESSLATPNPNAYWKTGNLAVAAVLPHSGNVFANGPGTTTLYAYAIESKADGTPNVDSVFVTVFTAVTKVEIDTTETITLPLTGPGHSVQLTATVKPDVAENKAVVWESEDEEIVEVAYDGTVSAKSVGETRVFAKAQANPFIADTITIKVEEVSVTKIEIADKEENDSVAVNNTLALTVNYVPVYATLDLEVKWTSADTLIAKVDSLSGEVKGIAAGKTRIYAETLLGGIKDSLDIEVYIVRVKSLKMDISSSNQQIEVGTEGKEAVILTAIIEPSDATNQTLIWESGNTALATVEGSGLSAIVTGTGKGEGDVTIRVKSDDNNAISISQIITVKINPNSRVNGVTLDLAEEVLLRRDSTLQLNATVLAPATPANPDVTWESSDETIATVDDNGLVIGRNSGITEIIVTTIDGDYKDTAQIRVYVPLDSITFSAGNNQIAVNGSQRITFQTFPGDATLDGWGFGIQPDSVAVIAFDDTGAYTVTGLSEGEATLNFSVTTPDNEYFYTQTLHVYTIIPKITGVSIVGGASVLVGETLQLLKSVSFEGDYCPAFTEEWSIRTGTGIAEINNAGQFTGYAVGEAEVFVNLYVDNVIVASDSKTISVVEPTPEPVVPKITDVTIGGAADSIEVGHTLQLEAVVTIDPADSAVPYYTGWASSDEEVASVDADGLVTALSVGETTITLSVFAEDSFYIAEAALKVYEAPIPEPEDTVPVPGDTTVVIPKIIAVAIQGATDSLKVDTTLQLEAEVIVEGEGDVEYEVAWESSDEEVATVDEEGLLTTLSAGQTTITLSVITEDTVYTDEITLSVYDELIPEPGDTIPEPGDSIPEPGDTIPEPVVPHITGVSIQGATDSLEVNKTLQLSAVVTIEPADSAVAYTVAWESSDEDVATVSKNGKVAAIGEGTVIITLIVTADGETFSDSLTLIIHTVSVAPVPGSVKAYIADNTLYINTPTKEKIDIYAISGQRIYSTIKPAGEVRLSLPSLANGVLIIRGATGWVEKVVK